MDHLKTGQKWLSFCIYHLKLTIWNSDILERFSNGIRNPDHSGHAQIWDPHCKCVFKLQERFLSDAEAYSKTDEESEFGYKWEVPVTYITSQDKKVSQVWMHIEDSSIEM